MRPLSVLFLYAHANKPVDATAAAVRQLAACLAIHGIESRVVGIPSGVSTGRRVGRSVAFTRYLLLAFGHILRQRGSVDLVVTIDVPSGLNLAGALARWCLRGRVHHLSWVLDLYRFQPVRGFPLLKRIGRTMDKAGIRASRHVVTIGSCMAGFIAARFGKQASVIPMWQDEAWLRPVDPTPLRRKLGIAAEEVVVLYSGHAGPGHPLGPLVSAMSGAAVGSRLRLVVAGYGTEFDRCRLEAKRAVPNALFLSPANPDGAAELLSLGDVHVVSLADDYLGTCMPSKTYAAMAVGRPCIFLGHPETQAAMDIASSGSGIVLRDPTVESVRFVLERYAASPELRADHGHNARQFFLDQRSLSTQTSEWAALIRRLVQPNG